MENNLSPASITTDLGTKFIGQKVIYYPRLTSTMALAGKEARRGAAEGTVILAGEQTAGKGRLRRLWLSPEGSVALSLILHPALPHLPSLIMLASLAVVHTIEETTGLKPLLKWPNDVLINGKKVSGILIENEMRRGRPVYAIIGIGINVNFRLADFPEISLTATSLSDELGKDVSLVAVIRHLLVETERLYLALRNEEPLFEEWRDKLVTLGKKVQVASGQTMLAGTAESVAGDGSLLLRHSNGSSTRIVAGDVNLSDY